MSARTGERGAALVMALVFAAGIAAAAVAFIEGRHSDALAMRAQVQAVEAEAMLEASLQQTAALLANRSERQVIPGSLSWRMGAAEVQVVIESEAGKIDLNSAEEALLQGLPLALGADEDRAAAFAQTVLDWRDSNSERHNQGAEDRDYDLGERGSSGAADRPLANPAELRYLAGVDPALWARLAPLVTVYSGSASPNRNKAPPTVRRAMAIAQGLASSKQSADDQAGGELEGDRAGADPGSPSAGLSSSGDRGSGLSTGSSAAGFDSATSGGLGSTGLGAGGGTEAGASRFGDAAGAGAADAADTAGSSTEEAAGAHTVLLDVRFPNGYEAAAKAVIGFSTGRQSGPPYTVLDWTPILREQGATP